MRKGFSVAASLCLGLPLISQDPTGLKPPKPKAEAGVSLYGVLDAGIAAVSHTLNFDPYSTVGVNSQANKGGDHGAIGMINGGISGSRLGIKGNLPLCDEFKGILNLEASINPRTGVVSDAARSLAETTEAGPYSSVDSSIRGQLFARNAYVGISSGHFGTLTLGRNTALALDFIGTYDAMQGAQLFTPTGFSGMYGAGGCTNNARADNSVKYILKVGCINFGLLHKFGGVAGKPRAGESNQAGVGFEYGPFGIQASYQIYRDSNSMKSSKTTAPSENKVDLTLYDTKSFAVTAKYKVGNLYLNTGYEQMKYTNPSHPEVYVIDPAATPAVANNKISQMDSQTVNLINVNSYPEAKKLHVFWAGANYDITTDLNLAAAYYQVVQNDYSQGATALSAKKAGNSRYYSALLDYRLNKAFDCYLGFMQNKVKDGMAYGYIHRHNNTTALGIRYKF